MNESKLVVCFSLESFNKKLQQHLEGGWHLVQDSVRQTSNNTFLFRVR